METISHSPFDKFDVGWLTRHVAEYNTSSLKNEPQAKKNDVWDYIFYGGAGFFIVVVGLFSLVVYKPKLFSLHYIMPFLIRQGIDVSEGQNESPTACTFEVDEGLHSLDDGLHSIDEDLHSPSWFVKVFGALGKSVDGLVWKPCCSVAKFCWDHKAGTVLVLTTVVTTVVVCGFGFENSALKEQIVVLQKRLQESESAKRALQNAQDRMSTACQRVFGYVPRV